MWSISSFYKCEIPNLKKKVNKKNYIKTLIKSGATLGANSTIICGNIVGKDSFVGAGSVVTKNINKNTVVVGNPAKKLLKFATVKSKYLKNLIKKI